MATKRSPGLAEAIWGAATAMVDEAQLRLPKQQQMEAGLFGRTLSDSGDEPTSSGDGEPSTPPASLGMERFLDLTQNEDWDELENRT